MGLIQYNLYPYKKWKFEHRDRHAERKGEVDIPGETTAI
jgi:hypothetical protein